MISSPQPASRLDLSTRFRIEADAIVADRQRRQAVGASDRDLYAFRVRVLGDVVERLLGDPEHGEVHRLGQIGPGASPSKATLMPVLREKPVASERRAAGSP